MSTLLQFLIHAMIVVAKILRPGGRKSVVAENLALKQQLIVLNRSRNRAPNLRAADRVLFALCTQFIRSQRLSKVAIVVRPSSFHRFHRLLVQRKYSEIFTPKSRGKPGPKGPSDEIIRLIVELKRRNPTFGCPRIASIVNNTFDVNIDRNVVRRILIKHYSPGFSGTDGPSWLTFFADSKDSLWSVDLFRCESIHLKTHWVLVVMDIYSRKIIGFAVRPISVDGPALCAMFSRAVSGHTLPQTLSSDNDPLFQYHRWQATLRILNINEIKSVPFVPRSHPFVERLIGTIRREYLDDTLFWTSTDLERKLDDFADYYNTHRIHSSLSGCTPDDFPKRAKKSAAKSSAIRWQQHLNGRYQLPVAA